MLSLGAKIVSLEEFNNDRPNGTIVATSCPGDPLHPGHISCMQEAKKLGDCLVVIVNGDDTTNTWYLYRDNLTSSSLSTIATANVNTEDSTISNATIDNSSYIYFLAVSMGSGDNVYSARITYTTDYI